MVNLKSWATVIFARVEFAHFLSIFKKLDRKKITLKKNKNQLSSRHFDADVSLVSRVHMQGNLITAPAEFDVTFDFAIYLCSQKCNTKIERMKYLPKCFSLMVTFYILSSKFKLFSCRKILLLMAKYFILDRHFPKTSFCSS